MGVGGGLDDGHSSYQGAAGRGQQKSDEQSALNRILQQTTK